MGKTIINFIASGFYISHIPDSFFQRKGKFRGCGLFGTLLAFPFFYILPQNYILFIIFLILFSFFSIYIAHNAFEPTEKDNPLIVIDEICGYFWGFLIVPLDFKNALIVLVLFRIFDTIKPWPIKKAESIPLRGAAIVIDDIIAGIYSSILTFIINKTIFLV